MTELDAIIARVSGSTTLPELLDACFDAFEVIRLVARGGEDRAPGLLAAFMATAGAAVAGRNALNDAPSLPLARAGPPLPDATNLTGDAEQLADDLAAAALLLARRLAKAATRAGLAADDAACERAARAATEIRRLLARDDETAVR
jgi:hypothetical protein